MLECLKSGKFPSVQKAGGGQETGLWSWHGYRLWGYTD